LPVERADEFGTWAISFNRMADALQEKIEALTAAHARERRFTSDVAHELRTPLTALMTSATFLRSQQHLMDADARWAADSVVSQVGRLRDLVEELLEISRMDSGQAAVSRYDIDLPWLLRTLLASRRWEDRVSLDMQVDRLNTDPRRLERIVANLVDNAFAHGDGPVEIAARREGQQLVISVGDRGPGIDPEALPHIFERFFKSDPARGGGSGLGLAIARENARLLGGDLTVARSDPNGTVMTVLLPLHEDEPLPEEPSPEAQTGDALHGEERELIEGVL
jgi:two-component system sensor histidine kinase MtrB